MLRKRLLSNLITRNHDRTTGRDLSNPRRQPPPQPAIPFFRNNGPHHRKHLCVDRLQQIDLSSSLGDIKGGCERCCDHAREGSGGKRDFEFVQDGFSVGLLAVPCYDSLFDILISHPVERYFPELMKAIV